MASLFTMGYEGRTIQEFVRILRKAGVKRLIDIRELPMSRKAGFSKSSLAQQLSLVGIAYQHVKELGSPRKIRHKYRADQNSKKFFEAYNLHLSQNKDRLDSIRRTLSIPTCFMCFERVAEECHRSVVVQKLIRQRGKGLQVVHL